MELFGALLKAVFDSKAASGGSVMCVNIHMISETHCSEITKSSSAGLDPTTIKFRPYLPIEDALLAARNYAGKGTFKHGDGKDD